MVRRKEAKITALLVVGVTLVLCFLNVPFSEVGIMKGCAFASRLVYHFFHASLLHWFANAWCLLSLFFIYNMSLRELTAAFVTSSLVPLSILPELPTVGLSGICFFLMGRIALSVRRKLYYQAWLAVYLALGFLFPNSNGGLHLYCYLIGLFIGFLNMPLR